MNRLLAGLLVLATGLTGVVAPAGGAVAVPGASWTTTVLTRVGPPGPAYVLAHRNGRVYTGTYVGPHGAGTASRVQEHAADGTLLRSWTVPGQRLDVDHGVQVAEQTPRGRLVVLETSTAAVMTLDTRTGRFRTVARLPAGSVPNYATWVRGGGLLVSDYAQGVIWKVRRDHTVTAWFRSPALAGVEFGTTGIVYRPERRDLLITQQTSSDGASPPTDGHLYRLPVGAHGRPGQLETLWTSRPGDLPDGFGIGRSGHVYVALAGLANQLVELTGEGVEVDRFPDLPGAGANGSPVPFDTPCSATFVGSRVLVANQSAVAHDASHQALLAVDVGETGVPTFLPARAVLH